MHEKRDCLRNYFLYRDLSLLTHGVGGQTVMY